MAGKIEEKLPPQNIEAEKCLLGSLMIDPEAILKVVDFLKPEDFYQTKHQKIYQAVIDLFSERDNIDILSVSNRLKEKKQFEEVGATSYLTSLVNSVPTASHITEYARIVQQKRVLRCLISVSQEINQLGYNEEENIDVLLDKAERSVFNIGQQSLTQKFTSVKDNLEETFKRIESLSENKGGLRGVSSGFKSLDNILAGFQKSDLVILAARPSMGKSALCTDIARNVALDYKIPVGIFSLEMSKDQIIDRLISAQADVDLWKLRTGRLSAEGKENDFERIQQAMGELSEAPIYIDDIASSNILQMRAMARRLQANKGLGLLIIDYLQLMQPTNSNLSMVQQVTENSKALKSLAKELNIPVLVLSQLSRAVEQRTPQIPRLADLRESGCLTGDSLITRADTGERIPIRELVGGKNIPVHSLNKNWKLEEKKISKVFSSGRKMTYELKLRSGKKIKASANHPFRKIDGWSRLDHLEIGAKIAVPNKMKIKSPKNNLSDKEIILLAHLIGDGCIVPRQPIHYTSADWNNIQIVKEVASDLFNIEPRIIKQKNWWHIYLSSPYHLSRGKHHPIVNFFSKLNIKLARSWEKEFPQAIYSLDKDKLALFLSHLWATDGNISFKRMKGRAKSAAIYYSSTSRKIAEGVEHILLRFNIRSRTEERNKPGYRTCYNVQIQGKEHQLKFLKEIGCFGKRGEIIPELINNLKEINSNTNLDVWPKNIWHSIIDPLRKERDISWREFSKGINMSYCGSTLFKSAIGLQRLNKINLLLKSPLISKMVESDVFWDEIVSITPLKVEEVYDATVPETHNFISNDIIVHNSIEQDADVVMFIYREDKYNENSPKKNIADIIIAKHRNGPVGRTELYFDETRVNFRDIEKGYEE